MGLIGLLATLLIVIAGAGYLLGFSRTPDVSLSNETSQGEQIAPQGVAAIDAARQISEQVTTNSKQTAEAIQQLAQDSEQGAENNQQTTGDKQQTAEGKRLNIVSRLVSFGHESPAAKRTIDTVVLHSSYNNQGGDEYSADKVIGIWKSYDVAPHYLIDRKGTVYRLVRDEDIAYHAGVSKMSDGRTNVNSFSIGVEILNSETDKYTDAQYAAVNSLIGSLTEKYGIKHVVGHADIAPDRKTDPWNFDWKKLK